MRHSYMSNVLDGHRNEFLANGNGVAFRHLPTLSTQYKHLDNLIQTGECSETWRLVAQSHTF